MRGHGQSLGSFVVSDTLRMAGLPKEGSPVLFFCGSLMTFQIILEIQCKVFEPIGGHIIVADAALPRDSSVVIPLSRVGAGGRPC